MRSMRDMLVQKNYMKHVGLGASQSLAIGKSTRRGILTRHVQETLGENYAGIRNTQLFIDELLHAYSVNKDQNGLQIGCSEIVKYMRLNQERICTLLDQNPNISINGECFLLVQFQSGKRSHFFNINEADNYMVLYLEWAKGLLSRVISPENKQRISNIMRDMPDTVVEATLVKLGLY